MYAPKATADWSKLFYQYANRTSPINISCDMWNNIPVRLCFSILSMRMTCLAPCRKKNGTERLAYPCGSRASG